MPVCDDLRSVNSTWRAISVYYVRTKDFHLKSNLLTISDYIWGRCVHISTRFLCVNDDTAMLIRAYIFIFIHHDVMAKTDNKDRYG